MDILGFLISYWWLILLAFILWRLGILASIWNAIAARTGAPAAPAVAASAGVPGAITGAITLLVAGVVVLGVFQPNLVMDVLDKVTGTTGNDTDTMRYRYIGRPDLNPQSTTDVIPCPNNPGASCLGNRNPGLAAQAKADAMKWDAQTAELTLKKLCASPDATWTAAGWTGSVPDLRKRYCSSGGGVNQFLKDATEGISVTVPSINADWLGKPVGTPPPKAQMPNGWLGELVKLLYAVPAVIIAALVLFILTRESK